MKHFPQILAVLAALVFAFSLRYCAENRNPDLPSVEPIPAEKQRESIITGRDKKNEQKAEKESEYLAQNKALSATISRLMANGNQKDKELAALYAKYAKKPTPGICDTLVREQKSRIDSLKSEVATHRKDSLNKAGMLKVYAEHLFDKDMRIDSLDAIAKDANKKLRKEKGKRFGVGVSAGYGASKQGLSPVISVGINYNLLKF